ncbi:MAG: carboxy terminal-processing peptidase [Gammaproteobacteria bacterium]|nr:carboxy terminal-processing peptidase [Gammaproteobacteria bacterium]
MTKMTRFYTPLLAACFLAIPATVLVPSTGVSLPQTSVLEPSPRHEKVSRLVTTLFERSHYRNARVDDALSSKILDRYLKALDSNRLYLTADDIDRFEKYRFSLDEAVKRGDMDPVFDIFRTYRVRLRNSIENALAQLDEEPDFTIDERYYFDRSEAEWAKDEQELRELWRKRVKNDMLSLVLTNKEWTEAADILRKRYNRVLKRTDQLNSDEVFETFMNSYADTLDPHSNYFSPRNSEEYRIQMSLSYDGIGASLQLTDDYVTVLDIIPGGPASIDGQLKRQDRITGVGQGDKPEITDVVGWRLDDVVQLIRGPGGTVVRLQVLPGGAAPGDPEQVIELRRDKVKLEAQAAQKSTIEVDRDGRKVPIGVIDIPSFYQDFQAKTSGDKNFTSTTRDVERLIGELRKDGIEGLVLDLRGNGGGHLSEATALSGLFIDNGPVVQLKDSSGRVEILRDKQRGIAWDGPLVILVDRFSASASEILAAAIQDYGRGLVIGQRTYGKGSVQNLYDLNRYSARPGQDDFGQLTVTIGKYYRVNGGSTQHRGVLPDIELPSSVDVSKVGESARETALPWDEIATTGYDLYGAPAQFVPSLINRHSDRIDTDPDFRFLLDSIAHANSEDRSVSLHREVREKEREAELMRRLERENERRAALNLEPLEKPEDLDEVEPVDVLLHETAEIVADIVAGPVIARADDASKDVGTN